MMLMESISGVVGPLAMVIVGGLILFALWKMFGHSA